uniref:Potassium voltage-gated channel subfamily KQT member 1 n=1 Tax=Romanomermis culicivorax TaxID=13658 RepID=A0A915J3C3_ROMCU
MFYSSGHNATSLFVPSTSREQKTSDVWFKTDKNQEKNSNSKRLLNSRPSLTINGLLASSDEPDTPEITYLAAAASSATAASSKNGPFERMFELHMKQREKRQNKMTRQGRIYNFLERPTGWKCFVYHFSV